MPAGPPRDSRSRSGAPGPARRIPARVQRSAEDRIEGACAAGRSLGLIFYARARHRDGHRDDLWRFMSCAVDAQCECECEYERERGRGACQGAARLPSAPGCPRLARSGATLLRSGECPHARRPVVLPRPVGPLASPRAPLGARRAARWRGARSVLVTMESARSPAVDRIRLLIDTPIHVRSGLRIHD